MKIVIQIKEMAGSWVDTEFKTLKSARQQHPFETYREIVVLR